MLYKNFSKFFLVCAMLLAADNSFAQQPTAKLTALLKEKEKIALALSEPPARCLQRFDTHHPAFHGCIDWHSSVHATWSLIAYQAMTGDKRYASMIEKILSPENLQAERDYLEANPHFEMPYGRAWFLRLALEYQREGDDGRLLSFGDVVAASLERHYRGQKLEFMNPGYQNASWALLNLLDYYQFRNQSENLTRLKKSIREQLLAQTEACDPQQERPEFMSMCYNLAWLAGKVLTEAEFKAWLVNYAPPQKLATPVKEIESAHEYGLNFSRSWGLWQLYTATGKAEYADAYVDHVRAGYNPKSNWDGEYRVNGHWVAQFGMFAIQPLFGLR